MGNCLERCSPKLHEEKKEEDRKKVERSDKNAKSIRVVLTKPEVDWLVQQLEQKPGKMSLEDLLSFLLEEPQWKEEERWRPVLESIMEVPEVQSVDNSAETEPRQMSISLII